MGEWDIQVEYHGPLLTVYTHVLSETPEEDATEIIMKWAQQNGLPSREKNTRMLGRNTYPTEKPEPHGYMLFLTVDEPIEETLEIKNGEIPGGYYAVLRHSTISEMSKAWPALWKWLEESEYSHTGWIKGEHGWESGLEENINLYDDLSPAECKFNLMIPVKNKP